MKTLAYDATAPHLSWAGAIEAIRAGHLLPRAQLGDLFLGPAEATQLTRAAFIEGLGYGVKAVTSFAGNAAQDLPTVQGAMIVFDPKTGTPIGLIDGPLITDFKTAADSVLGARLLSRPDSRHLLIVGAGRVAENLARAYAAGFDGLERISIWARRASQAEAFATSLGDMPIAIEAVQDLPDAVAAADIVSTATLTREPVLRGEWVRPGTHIDLIGAFRADMREADDSLITKGSLFVDSRDTTIHHIGELKIPIASGILTESDVRGDFYDLVAGTAQGRVSSDEITVFKNGGGAHLDLMVADYMLRSVGDRA